MKDLLELVKSCDAAKADKKPNWKVMAQAEELGMLGFEALAKKLVRSVLVAEKLEMIAAEKLPVITNDKIQKFLDGLSKDYNEKKRSGLTMEKIREAINQSEAVTFSTNTSTGWFSLASDSLFGQTPLISITRDHLSMKEGTIGSFRWTETKISEYTGVPPRHALDALKRAQDKEIFDYFTIASVSAVKDPLLLGRLEGHEDRWYLAQWGDDVKLDDII